MRWLNDKVILTPGKRERETCQTGTCTNCKAGLFEGQINKKILHKDFKLDKMFLVLQRAQKDKNLNLTDAIKVIIFRYYECISRQLKFISDLLN